MRGYGVLASINIIQVINMKEKNQEEHRMKLDVEAANLIIEMPREQFWDVFIRNIGQTRAFGALVSLKTKHMSPEEKQDIRKKLNDAGIPYSMTDSDEKLDTIAATVAARSMNFLS